MLDYYRRTIIHIDSPVRHNPACPNHPPWVTDTHTSCTNHSELAYNTSNPACHNHPPWVTDTHSVLAYNLQSSSLGHGHTSFLLFQVVPHPPPLFPLGHGFTPSHRPVGSPPPCPPFLPPPPSPFLPNRYPSCLKKPPSTSLGHGNTSYLHYQAEPPPPPPTPPQPSSFLPTMQVSLPTATIYPAHNRRSGLQSRNNRLANRTRNTNTIFASTNTTTPKQPKGLN